MPLDDVLQVANCLSELAAPEVQVQALANLGLVEFNGGSFY